MIFLANSLSSSNAFRIQFAKSYLCGQSVSVEEEEGLQQVAISEVWSYLLVFERFLVYKERNLLDLRTLLTEERLTPAFVANRRFDCFGFRLISAKMSISLSSVNTAFSLSYFFLSIRPVSRYFLMILKIADLLGYFGRFGHFFLQFFTNFL